MKTQLKLYSIVILCFLTLLNVKAADLPTSYLQVGGTTRSMLVHVPTNLQSNRPLVISLHGMGQDPNYQKGMANWEAVADTANFVVVYPQGVNNAWDISGDSDINFILAIIDEMNSKYAIDKSRVYVSGFSMGGMMTYHAANKIADKIAAFAPVSGFMCWGNATYNSSRAIPIIHVHGDADNVVYYDASGGQSGLAPIISGWVDRNNCSKNAIVTYPHSSATKEVYSNGECDTEVVLVTLSG